MSESETMDAAWARSQGALGEWGHIRSITRIPLRDRQVVYEGVIASGGLIRTARNATLPALMVALANLAEEWLEDEA